jgi:hypothetical protein
LDCSSRQGIFLIPEKFEPSDPVMPREAVQAQPSARYDGGADDVCRDVISGLLPIRIMRSGRQM